MSEKLYWTMRDGSQIDIDDMTESHLRNSLKMVARKVQLISDQSGNFGMARAFGIADPNCDATLSDIY